jgi:stearoyl-CoA desaturase (delta-9 desaturase)
MLAIDLLLFGWAGAVIWLVQMAWIPFWAAGVINGIGHYWGYRNFETQDASRNIVPWGILIGGEELHNNHHAYGVSARLSNKWWEFDIGWLYIRILETFGLAKVRRVAPKATFASDLGVVDMETLKAVVSNRFHVLKLYGSEVIAPVIRGQADVAGGRIARRHWRRLRKRLASENPAMENVDNSKLAATLESNQTLQTIYDFKQKLKDVWTQRSKDQAELLSRLQAWCADAEASGISALRQFSRQLRGYRSQLAS